MKRKRKNRNIRGFTLIEIMAVVVIIGILATGATYMVIQKVSQARVTQTKRNIKSAEDAVNMFKMDTGQYPKKLEDLVNKPSYVKEEEWGGYTDSIPTDGWGNPLKYEVSGDGVVIKSLGADNAPGGQGENADISNLTMKEKASN